MNLCFRLRKTKIIQGGKQGGLLRKSAGFLVFYKYLYCVPEIYTYDLKNEHLLTTMECQYCKCTLMSKSSLNYHKKNNKKCLEIQSANSDVIVSDLVMCTHCNTSHARSNIAKHLTICKALRESNHETIVKEHEQFKTENQKLRFENERLLLENEQFKVSQKQTEQHNQQLKEYNEQLKIQVAILERESAIYSKDRDHKDEVIISMAQQPKTSNRTTVNVTNNLSTFDPDEVKQRVFNVMSSMTKHDVVEGQRGLGRLIGSCLNNSDGTKMMTCSDYSRGIFLLKNSDGNIDKDIKCQKLVDLIEPITSAKTDEIYNKECELREKIRTVNRLRGEIEKDGDQLESWESNLKGHKTDSHMWKQIIDRIESRGEEIKAKKREVDMLVRELKSLPPNIDIRNDMVDLRLYEGACDIKSMSKDSTTFSKTVAENLQRA